MNIPRFQRIEHEQEFGAVFCEKASTYIQLMDVVKELMFGAKCEYSNLPGQCLEVVNDITRSLLYDAETQFKEYYPEYKTEDDEIFIPRRSFKEDVTEALKEAMNKEHHNWDHNEDGLAESFTLGDK